VIIKKQVETIDHIKNGATLKSHMSWNIKMKKMKKMKNKAIIITAVLLILSIGNYFRIISDGSIRTVEFLSIFALGVLTGAFATQIIKTIKYK